jgi:hypothetical protein
MKRSSQAGGIDTGQAHAQPWQAGLLWRLLHGHGPQRYAGRAPLIKVSNTARLNFHILQQSRSLQALHFAIEGNYSAIAPSGSG